MIAVTDMQPATTYSHAVALLTVASSMYVADIESVQPTIG